MEKQDHLNKVLKKAKVITNLSVTVVVLVVLFPLINLLFPYLIDFNQLDEPKIEQLSSRNDFEATYGIDPTEIKNGIHLSSGLIVDEGIEIVNATCAACHSIDLVTQNRADSKGWKDIIVWMQETQGLWDLGPNESIIISYLAKNYAPEDTGRRRNLKNIEWYEL